MNHLAHFAVTDDRPDTLVGTFLGDYVKGRLRGTYARDVERGIRLHRAVDAFTDHHPIAKRSHRRFAPGFYRYGSIMTDIIYDHFLARRWHHYYDMELEQFSRQTLATLCNYHDILPEQARKTLTRMYKMNALAGHGSEAFVERSLSFLSSRLSRPNPLDIAFSQFVCHRDRLETDFEEFYPELTAFCRDWLVKNPMRLGAPVCANSMAKKQT